MLIGALLSDFGTDTRASIYQRIKFALKEKDYLDFLSGLRSQIKPDLNVEEVDGPVDLQVGAHYFALGSLRRSARSFIVALLGRGSTFRNTENIYKIDEYYDYTIVTPRDYVYYPGLSKLAAFFVMNFDTYRADAFMFQFVRTAYSGVYGPRRFELPYVTRIEDVPTDFYEKTSFTRESFMLPHQVAEIKRLYHPKRIIYRPLKPIPKTLDDVLDAANLILTTYREQGKKAVAQEVWDPENIYHLQSFYLDLATATECLEMMEAIPSGPQRNHFASHLYAAFLHYKSFFPPQTFKFNWPEIKTIMIGMFEMSPWTLKDLDAIHQKSERASGNLRALSRK